MASVDWGPWGEESKAFKPKSWSWGCQYGPYKKAATTTMVIGRILSILAKNIQQDITGSLKTFCIGHSLGGHICGFAGKDYRLRTKKVTNLYGRSS